MQTLTFLIIDDTRSARDTAVLATQLLAAELDVRIAPLTAQSGVEGAQRLRDHAQIDLVLLDIHLPGPDVDGRLLATLIRQIHPNAQILPFTADRSPEMAADLQALGMDALVIKPIAPKELANQMRQVLQRPAEATTPPLQGFLANQTRHIVQLLEQKAATPLPTVALLARNHLVCTGLAQILQEARRQLPFTLVAQASTAEALRAELQRDAVRLLVCTPDAMRSAEELAAVFRVPLLIYATIDAAAEVLERPWSVVVGPTGVTELVEALERTLAGEVYRNPQVAAVLRLTERHYRMIQLLVQGASTTKIAGAIGISEDWARHVMSGLYDQLGLPHNRGALLDWARKAPLHLLDQRQW